MSYVLRVSLTFIVDYEGVRCSCQVAIISHCQVKLVQCWGGACHMQSTDYQYWTSHLVNATEVVHMLTLSGPLHSLDKFKVSTVQSRGHQCNTLIYNPYLKYYNSETEHKM